ncbi:hypothetical protein [Leptospira noguchii]
MSLGFNPLPLKQEEETPLWESGRSYTQGFNPLPLKQEEETQKRLF